MTSRWVDITADDGGRFQGYLAVPASGSGPGIMLLQEIFGVNAHLRAVADLYAEEGYVVLAPDLFWRLEPKVDLGYGETDVARARDLLGRLDIDRAVADCGAA
jgi:carboxymethylenebutenolidase